MLRDRFRSLLRLYDRYSPWPVQPRDRILSAVSSDGLEWIRERGLRCNIGGQAGIDMLYYCCIAPMGQLGWRIYYGGSSFHADAWRSRIYSAHTIDGTTWVPEPGFRLMEGGPHDDLHCRAPVVISTGNVHRMYYVGVDRLGVGRVLSAVSSDGITWMKETGIRLDGAQVGSTCHSIEDVYVSRFGNGELRMYVSATRTDDSGIFSAGSSDGINWSMDPGARITGRDGPGQVISTPCLVCRGSNSYRLYYRAVNQTSVGSEIYAADSLDGINFQNHQVVLRPLRRHRYERHSVGFPHVVRLADGRWRMYYTGYWGRHLLERRTLKSWSSGGRNPNSVSDGLDDHR